MKRSDDMPPVGGWVSEKGPLSAQAGPKIGRKQVIKVYDDDDNEVNVDDDDDDDERRGVTFEKRGVRQVDFG